MSNQRAVLLELAKRKQKEDWKRNPLLWLKERLGEEPKDFKWSLHNGYKNHEWDGTKDPLSTAWQVLGTSYGEVADGKLPTHKNVALESGTGTGKTYELARIVLWFLDCFEKSLVVTSAPSEVQLKLGLWSEISMLYPKIKKLRPNAKKWQLRLAMEMPSNKDMTEEERAIAEENAWHAVGFTTGVKADETSSNKARGFHRKNMLIILEEATGIPIPILTAFQNTCTGNTNFILAVGNPDNEFDALHQFSIQKDCFSIRASSLDHPNIVLQEEIYPGAITQSSINSRKDNYGEESPLFQAMVRGISPAQSTDSLIRKEWVEACTNTDHEDTQDSSNAVGVDVSNSPNGDKASTCYGEGNTLVEVYEFYCDNATHLAYNMYYESGELDRKKYSNYNIPNIDKYDIEDQYIGVDAVGVGVATINAFKDDNFEVQALQGGQWSEVIPTEERWEAGKKIEQPMYRFPNLRAQMYWELREDLRLKKINIKVKDKVMLNQLTKELCIAKYKADGTYIKLEGKDDIKKRLGGKSPNVADGIVYWNWTRKGYRAEQRGWAAMSAGD